ncbi:DinB family protein [Cohnella cholangitidis]|uniref:Uncharacterized protein n=1 Tax=Cohnella cholangitidis TaxID=2598458 RepID=A0A7G5BST5_9BACL|nr:hypothetical protein [Cohnella cholangitidis]QMV40019.1 hypothetical protein FPL14_01490 [Cohnella cholangitidis]
MVDHIRFPIGKFEQIMNPTAEERANLIDQVPEIARSLRTIVNDLTPEKLNIPYRQGGWTIKQIIHPGWSSSEIYMAQLAPHFANRI